MSTPTLFSTLPHLAKFGFSRVLPALLINKALFFAGYLYTQNPCIVDCGWVVGHFVAAGVYAHHFGAFTGGIKGTNGLIMLGLVGFWCLRLAGFIFKERIWNRHLDDRYEKIYSRFNSRAIAAMYQFTLQGFLVLFTSIPLYYVFSNPIILKPGILGAKNLASIALIITGIVGQAIADNQLQDFKNKKKSGKTEESTLRTGLWENCRHPNLFFELVTWYGFASFGINSIASVWALSGPFFLYLIMDKLTVPLTTRSMRRKRGQEYEDYIKATNKYWPFSK